MSEEPVVIAHDLGTTGDKASLHDVAGRILGVYTAPYATRFGAGGVAEQDPEDWWRAVGEATRVLLSRAGVSPGRVLGTGLSGQMMGAVFLDEDLVSLRPSLIWADHRSTAQADRLVDAVGMEAAYAELGHRIDPTYTLSKAMWVRDREPRTWARTRHLCLAKDYVAMQMTGTLVTDHSDASSTNAYDQGESTWSRTMLAAAEVDAGLMPPIVSSTTVVGGLTPEAAGHVGLDPGAPVVIGGGDGPMAAVGAGVVEPEDGAYACLGSSSWISVAAPRPLLDPAMRSMTFDHVVPGHYVPTATMQAGGACLQWVMELFGTTPDAAGFAAALAAAGEVVAADEGLFFLPHLLGERSPYWNPVATGVFAGLGRHHRQPHLVRAVLEGVAFNLRTCLGAFTEGGVAVDAIDVIGGGANSDVWLQILADAWGVPVRRRDISDEANSLGAAVTTLVGLGLADGFGMARGLSQRVAEFVPRTAESNRRAEQHHDFLQAYSRLEPWFARHSRGGRDA
ncbi:MAG: xylulokinase [Marmoricola sp.]